MIQDIAPRKFDNTYCTRNANLNDIVLLFQDGKVLLSGTEEQPVMLTQERLQMPQEELYYLFSIDAVGFFLATSERLEEMKVKHGLTAHHTNIFRILKPDWQAFGGITASQLYRWKSSRTYCGRCGTPTEASGTERAMVCSKCGLTEYPKISPATITAIIDVENERLLMARNKRSTYTRWGLIAGFVEIGETFEDTVHREAMEEVGLKVSRVTYFKSQPWGFSDTEMVGFFAVLDGSSQLTIEEDELSEARWFSVDEIPDSISDISIGYELIEAVRTGEYKKYLL